MAAAAVAAGAAAAVPEHDTAAGDAAAARLLLRPPDLGRGWSATPAPRHVPILTCPRFHPPVPGVLQVGAAVSPTFVDIARGTFVASAGYELRTAAEVATVWRRLITPRFKACVADSLTSASDRRVRFTLATQRVLGAPRVAGRRRAYRVTGTGTSSGQTVGVDLDVIVLANGPALTTLSLISIGQAPAAGLELHLARVLARRLAAHR